MRTEYAADRKWDDSHNDSAGRRGRMIELHHMSASNICFQTSPVVTHPSFIQVVKDGKVLGEVNASFDFSSLPAEHHILALQLLRGHRISLPSDLAPADVKVTESRPWWKIW